MLVFVENSLGEFADGIAKYRKSEDAKMRRSVYTSLLNYVQRDNTLAAKIVPWLIEGMADSNDEIRAMIVPVLGRVKAESALPLLIKARSDENPKARMHAAFAIWQITGDKEQAVKALTVRLRSKNLEGQQEAIYLLGELGDLPEITIKALLAKTDFNEKKDYQNAAITAKHGIKQAAIQTLLKVAPDALPAELKQVSK